MRQRLKLELRTVDAGLGSQSVDAMKPVVTDPRTNLLLGNRPLTRQKRRSSIASQKALDHLQLELCFVICHVTPLKFVQLLGVSSYLGRFMTRNLPERITNLFNVDMPDDKNWLSLLVTHGLDQLTMPGAGRTLERWMALAAVGRFDLSLAKLYEGHTDALAILSELGVENPAHGIWCVWAAGECDRGGFLTSSLSDLR